MITCRSGQSAATSWRSPSRLCFSIGYMPPAPGLRPQRTTVCLYSVAPHAIQKLVMRSSSGEIGCASVKGGPANCRVISARRPGVPVSVSRTSRVAAPSLSSFLPRRLRPGSGIAPAPRLT